MRLIENSKASDAYRFGLHRLWPAFAEHAWLYVVFIAFDAVIAGTLTHDRSLGFIAQLLATFPALAYCGRLLRPGYEMTVRDVIAILAMMLILTLLSAIFFVLERVLVLIPGVGLLLVLGALVAFVWITVKLGAGPVLWIATRSNNVIVAFVESWSTIQGSVWWTVFITGLLIGLSLVIPLIAAVVFVSSAGAMATWIGAVVSASLSVIGVIWVTLALAAIMSVEAEDSIIAEQFA